LPYPDTNCGGPQPIFCAMEFMNCVLHTGPSSSVLYFFHGRDIVVLSHGVTKSPKVPNAEIERAMERKQLVMKDPARYAGKLSPKEV